MDRRHRRSGVRDRAIGIICSAIEPSAAADLGAYAILEKPLDFDVVIALLRSV